MIVSVQITSVLTYFLIDNFTALLLHIPSDIVPELPIYARTILRTLRKQEKINNLGTGEFVYLGIKKYFQMFYKQVRISLNLGFNIDGVSIFNPVLANTVLVPNNLVKIKPFVVAVFDVGNQNRHYLTVGKNSVQQLDLILVDFFFLTSD